MSARVLGLSVSRARQLLIASLVVNFVIIGAAFGLGIQGMSASETPKRKGGAFSQIADFVAEDRRDKVQTLMAERSKKRNNARAMRTESWRQVAEVVERENFDVNDLRSALITYSDEHNQRRKEAYAPLIEAIALMNHEERAKVADTIRAFAERRAKRR